MALEIPKMIQESNFPEGARRVLAGAAEMFALKGFAATSVRQIAEAAEMSVPMVYYYFPGKDDVFRALMQVVMDYVEDQMMNSLPAERDLRCKLIHILRFNVKIGIENPRMISMLMSALFGPQEGRPELPVTDQHECHLQALQSLFEGEELREGLTPRFLAGQFMGLKNHLMLSSRALVDPHLANFHDEIRESFSDEGIERMVDHFLYGSLAPQRETL